MDSPFIENAAHINGNPDLPVFQLEKEFIQKINLPNIAQQWQIAMNHPTPLAITTDKQSQQMTFIYTIPGNDGTALIIRDESLLNNLMIGTLDNKVFFSTILNTFCADKFTCTIKLFEPEASYPNNSDLPLSDSVPSKTLQSLSQIKENIEKLKESHGDGLKKLPWGFILLLLTAIWTAIALLMNFPPGRSK